MASHGTLSLLGVLGLALAATAADKPRLDPPDAKRILAELRAEHPRLIVPADRWQELRQLSQKDETLARWNRALHREAEGILRAAPSQYEIPDGKRLLATSRRVLDRVTTLAFLYRLDDDRRYAERAWRELEAAAGFKDWNPSHFLDTAEMTAAFAVGYDWLYDAWTPKQRQTLRTAIVQLGLTPGLNVYRRSAKGGGWPNSEHNWNQVCNGGLTLGALAIADEEPVLAGEILEQAVRSVPRAMRNFAPDGAWAEGPGYWSYATQYNVLMLAGLDSAVGTDYGLSQIPGFSEAGIFPLYICGPGGTTFNYADAHAGSLRPWQQFWFARKFQRPEYAAYQIPRARPTALDLVFYDPRGRTADIGRLPLDKHFRQAEVGVFRSDWTDPEAWFLAFKAGANPANHSHLDLGTFVLDALGERWFVDLGSDDYNFPGYFGSQRWDYYRLRAEGHNTLVINPGQRTGPGPAGRDQDHAVRSRDQDHGGDGRARPDAGLCRSRHAGPPHVRDAGAAGGHLRDEIKAKNPAEIWSFLHTPAKVELGPDQRTARLTLGGKSLLVELAAPPSAKLEVLPASPLATSPHPPRQGENRSVQKLAVHLQQVSEATIEFRLTPGR